MKVKGLRERILDWEKANSGYFGKDVKDVSKDVKDKGLYGLLSAGMVVVPALTIACNPEDNNNTNVPKDVVYNITAPLSGVAETSIDGKVQTDVATYPVNHTGELKCQYMSNQFDSEYSSDTNAGVNVKADDNGVVIPLIPSDIMPAITAMTGGTNSTFEGKVKLYIPDDSANLGVPNDEGIVENAVDDAKRLRNFINKGYYPTRFEETNETSGENVVAVYFNQDYNANEADTEAGQRTSGGLYFRDGAGLDAFGEELLEVYVGTDDVSGYDLPFKCLLNGTGGSNPLSSDTITEGDKAMIKFLADELKTSATFSDGIIYNK